jgi:hypothetical protein
MSRLLCLALLSSAIAASCSDSAPATEVVLCISATPEVMSNAETVVIRVFGRPTDTSAWVERLVETRPIAALPLTLGVHPRGRDAERQFRVEVEATGPLGVIAAARINAAFIADETRGASLLLDHRCADTCGTDRSCVGGTCVGATWSASALSSFSAGSCRAIVDAGPPDVGVMDQGTDAGDSSVDAGHDAGSEDAGQLDGAMSHDVGVDDAGMSMDMGVTTDLGVTSDLGTDLGPPDMGAGDMGWDAGDSSDAGVDGGGEVGRRLVMQLSAAAHAECAGGGWILSVYFDAPIAAPGQGQPLDIRLPGPAAFVGDLGVSAYCPTSDSYRNWAPFSDQVASAAGFTTMTLDGVDLADSESVVCNYFPTCPFGPASYWTTPRVPLQLSLHGMCVPSPSQCPDWCQSPC